MGALIHPIEYGRLFSALRCRILAWSVDLDLRAIETAGGPAWACSIGPGPGSPAKARKIQGIGASPEAAMADLAQQIEWVMRAR